MPTEGQGFPSPPPYDDNWVEELSISRTYPSLKKSKNFGSVGFILKVRSGAVVLKV